MLLLARVLGAGRRDRSRAPRPPRPPPLAARPRPAARPEDPRDGVTPRRCRDRADGTDRGRCLKIERSVTVAADVELFIFKQRPPSRHVLFSVPISDMMLATHVHYFAWRPPVSTSQEKKVLPNHLRPDDRRSLKGLTTELRSLSDKLERIQQVKHQPRPGHVDEK